MSIAARLNQEMDAADRVLARSIFGTDDPQQIAATIAAACQSLLGQSIRSCKFWEVSVSFTIGLQLANQEWVVLKFRSPDQIKLEMLQAVCQVQQALSEAGFPAPSMLAEPIEFETCLVSVEQYLDVGDNCDAHDPQIRRAMAIGLVPQIELARSFVALPGLQRSRFYDAVLWEKPHNALFDFEHTAAGAEWIDEIAATAKEVLLNYDAPLQVGHMDWSVKNMRFQAHRLSAVYDWDSLRLENELVIVGNAAKGFLVTWYVDAGILVPTPTEVNQFIQAYESARSCPFTATERQIISAAFLYSMAYTARCEHAIDPIIQPHSFRAGLQRYRVYPLL